MSLTPRSRESRYAVPRGGLLCVFIVCLLIGMARPVQARAGSDPASDAEPDHLIYLPTVYADFPIPRTPASPYPQDRSANLSVNSYMAWSSNNADAGPLTYDIYLEANDDTPDLLVAHRDVDNFSPGTLELVPSTTGRS